MADLSEFIPLVRVELAELRSRADAQVNAGIGPEDDSFVDTTPGGFWWDLSQAILIELERAYDLLGTEFPAASNLLFAFGDYLDDWGDALAIPRLPAEAAAADLLFTGAEDTDIATGTEVAVLLADPDATEEDEVVFETAEGGIIPAGGTLTLAARAQEAGSRGNVGAGTLTVLLTAIDGVDEVVNLAAADLGRDTEEDEPYRSRLLLGMAPGSGGGTIADIQRWGLEQSGIGFVYVRPFTPVAGEVEVWVTNHDNAPPLVEVRRAFHDRLDPAYATTALNGAQSLSSATLTVDSTAGFRASGRIVADDPALAAPPYLITYTGLTATTFTGCSGGPALTAADNTIITQRGSGAGLLRENAESNVRSPSLLQIDVGATVFFQPGFSLDGGAATTALRDAIEGELLAYLNRREPGEDILINAVEGQFFRVRGIRNVTTLTLNGSAADVVVAATQLARADAITLTAG